MARLTGKLEAGGSKSEVAVKLIWSAYNLCSRNLISWDDVPSRTRIGDMTMRTRRFAGRLRRVMSLLMLSVLCPWIASGQDQIPEVTIVATGGTIAGKADTRTSFQSYRAGQLPIEDMVDELRPQIDEVANVTTVQFGNRGSGSYDISDYFDLTIAVDAALETADAVVVTSGTTTMEEFAFWLDLTVRSQKPVVITGAMRPWTVISSDGPANLFNSIVLAASRETHCFGTVLMLNDEFHAAKEVWKSNGMRLDTFTSRELGILGYIDEREVRTYRAPPRVQACNDRDRWVTPFDLEQISKDQLPRTEILIGYQGAGLDEAITAWSDAGVKGIVIAGGRGSDEVVDAAEANGVVFHQTQRFRTGGDNLYPQKARLLLMLSLAFSSEPNQIENWFTRYGFAEFSQ